MSNLNQMSDADLVAAFFDAVKAQASPGVPGLVTDDEMRGAYLSGYMKAFLARVIDKYPEIRETVITSMQSLEDIKQSTPVSVTP